MLAYERHGQGEPLVLIHGIGHRRQTWYPVLDALAEKYDVILVDLPGHGESVEPLAADVIPKEALAEAFEELFDHLCLEDAHLVGNSLGGLIALELSGAGLGRSVTALSPAGFWSSSRDFLYVRALFGSVLLTARAARPLAPPLLGTALGRGALLGWLHTRPWRVDAGLARADFANLLLARPVVRRLLAAAYTYEPGEGTGVPVTVAWSARDRVLLPYQARRARSLLPGADHLWLERCGHVPMPDDPDLVVSVITRTVDAAASGRIPATGVDVA